MPNMQVLCPYYVKEHMKAMLYWQMCFIFQIWAKRIDSKLIKHLFHIFLQLFRFNSKYGCPISSKITKVYFISNIIQLPRG